MVLSLAGGVADTSMSTGQFATVQLISGTSYVSSKALTNPRNGTYQAPCKAHTLVQIVRVGP